MGLDWLPDWQTLDTIHRALVSWFGPVIARRLELTAVVGLVAGLWVSLVVVPVLIVFRRMRR